MAIRMTKEARKASILEAALIVAQRKGFGVMRQSDIAMQADCSHGLVTLSWSTLAQLRRAVMRAAIQRRILKIVAAGLALGDKDAKKAPEDLKEAARAALG